MSLHGVKKIHEIEVYWSEDGEKEWEIILWLKVGMQGWSKRVGVGIC